MPIGVPMIWDTPRSQKLHLREEYHVLPGFTKHHSRVWFIIDGQQRVSALYHAQKGDGLENGRLKPIDFKKVVFALEESEAGKRVQYRRPLESEYVLVCDILGSGWRGQLGALGKRKLERVRRFRQRLLDYPMQFMFLDGNIDDVREAFLRVNTLGMKVTTALSRTSRVWNSAMHTADPD
jgi:hypothetical protein